MLGVIDQRHIDVFEVLSRRVVNDPRRTPRPLLLRPKLDARQFFIGITPDPIGARLALG